MHVVDVRAFVLGDRWIRVGVPVEQVRGAEMVQIVPQGIYPYVRGVVLIVDTARRAVGHHQVGGRYGCQRVQVLILGELDVAVRLVPNAPAHPES